MKQSSSKQQSVSMVWSAIKMAIATFSSRILGLIREQVLASLFGATGVTDAFMIAFRIPNMLRDLFAEGVFSSAFVPIFTKTFNKDKEKAISLMWSLFIILGVITSLLSIGMIIFSEEIVRAVTDEKFVANTESFLLTVNMVKVMAPFLVLISLAALFMGVLNSIKIFFVPSLAPAMFNIMMILCMIFIPPYLKENGIHEIYALSFGVIAGGLAQLLVQLPLIIKNNLLPNGKLQFVSNETKSVVGRLGIGTIGVAATQINILVTTILATGTVVGAVSWLTFAFRLFQFPVGILSVSIAGSNLVHFSESYKKKDLVKAVNVLKTSYLFSIFTIFPAFVLIFSLARESVHLVFERGHFLASDTTMTTLALKYYLVGLPFYGLYKIFAPTFFSIDKPKIPVYISIVSIILNIIFCISLVPTYGFKILALGTSVSMIVNSTMQSFFLSKYLSLKLSFFFNIKVLKYSIAAIIQYLITIRIKGYLFNENMNFLTKSSGLLFIVFISAICYLLVLFLLGEQKTLKSIIKK